MTSVHRFETLLCSILLFIVAAYLLSSPVRAETIVHTVKPGDTAWKIHERYYAEPVTLRSIRERILARNGISDARLLPVGPLLLDIADAPSVPPPVVKDEIAIGIDQVTDRIGQVSVAIVAAQDSAKAHNERYDIMARELAAKEEMIGYLVLVAGSTGSLACVSTLGVLFGFSRRRKTQVSNTMDVRSPGDVAVLPALLPRQSITHSHLSEPAGHPYTAHIKFSFVDNEGMKRDGRVYLDREISFGYGNPLSLGAQYRRTRQSLQHFFAAFAALDPKWRQYMLCAFQQGRVEVNLD